MPEQDVIVIVREFCSTVHQPEVGDDAMLSVAELRGFGFTPRKLYPPIPAAKLRSVEEKLGFTIPPILFALLSQVSNGIAGFCYQFIGVDGGCQCHLGDILDTYNAFEEEGIKGGVWQDGLLPFVSWGCNIFSCIDSHHPNGEA